MQVEVDWSYPIAQNIEKPYFVIVFIVHFTNIVMLLLIIVYLLFASIAFLLLFVLLLLYFYLDIVDPYMWHYIFETRQDRPSRQWWTSSSSWVFSLREIIFSQPMTQYFRMQLRFLAHAQIQVIQCALCKQDLNVNFPFCTFGSYFINKFDFGIVYLLSLFIYNTYVFENIFISWPGVTDSIPKLLESLIKLPRWEKWAQNNYSIAFLRVFSNRLWLYV